MSRLTEALQDKDNNNAYALSRDIAAKSAASNEYYSVFDEFAGLLTAKSSYVRTRGFALCCAQARWDEEGKLKTAFPAMLALLHDEKPTVVRQCIGALREVALYRPEMCGDIKAGLETIDLTRYKDSVSPLIRKDADELLKLLE